MESFISKFFLVGASSMTLLQKVFYFIIILVLAKIAKDFLNTFVKNFFLKSKTISERKAKTLSSLSRSLIRYGIDFIAIYSILTRIFGVPDAAIIAFVSVFTVAIGLGAQNFVKDIITGFLFVLEDQFGVGDYVSLDARVGVIEAMGLRTTGLRSEDGYLYIIPNSQISVVTNMCKGFLRAIVDVTVGYDNDTDKVIEVLNDEMKKQKEILTDLSTVPEVLGISKMGGGTAEIRIRANCVVGKKDFVERALRKAIKERFELEKIS